MATSAIEGAQYLQSRAFILTFLSTAPSTPISANNQIATGSYYFTCSVNAWVRLGNSNTDAAATPTATQPAANTPNREFFCPADLPVPVDIPAGVSPFVTAIGEAAAGNLRITGPIATASLT